MGRRRKRITILFRVKSEYLWQYGPAHPWRGTKWKVWKRYSDIKTAQNALVSLEQNHTDLEFKIMEEK